MGKSIQELVSLAAKGNQSAIGELYQQTYASVYKTVKLLVKDDEVALDIVQESYIKGFQNLNQLDAPEHFQAWMKTIASNKARDYFRKKKDTLFSEMENEDGDIPEFEDTCIENLPEAVLDREETARLLKEIIDSLSEDQRAVIYMYHYKEMTVQQIAAALECSENTIKSRLRYARNKIKEKVEDLEKKGTKLYSLSPISFFTFLLRMAKKQGITFILDEVGKAAAAGTATAVTEAASAAGSAATAAGETAAGSAATANAAAGVAAKAAGGAAGKALATKIVAGTLAAAMMVGAGAVAVNSLSGSKDNKEAHVIYEEFLGRYKTVLEMNSSERFRAVNQFWNEVCEDVLEHDPEGEKNGSWYLDYNYGEDFAEGVPVPNSVYDINMNELTVLCHKLEDEQVRYAFYDTNDDGVDEMFVSMFYRGSLIRQDHLNVYAVKDGKLYRGSVDAYGRKGDVDTWVMELDREATYDISPGLLYINLGNGYFDVPIEIEEPELDWQILCAW